MIAAIVGVAFEAVCVGAPTGLVGTITVEIYDPTDGSQIIAPHTAGITEPKPGTYRTAMTAVTVGSYMIRWQLPSGGAAAEEELLVTQFMEPIPDTGDFVKPTVEDIGALLRARTQNDDDDEIGTFDDTTRPTGEEVDRIINMATSVVLSRTGSLNTPPMICDTAADLRTNAQTAVSMLASMLVELTYFPEQVASNRSAYEDYRDLWTSMMTSLIDAAKECRAGEIVPETSENPGPSWSFPIDGGGLIGWQTQW